MATLDWSQCPAVESVPDRRSGAWVFRSTRMPVATVFENLEAGSSIEEIIEQFHVTREQIQAVLEFAARSLDPQPPAASAATSADAHSLLTRGAQPWLGPDLEHCALAGRPTKGSSAVEIAGGI